MLQEAAIHGTREQLDSHARENHRNLRCYALSLSINQYGASA
jgi:hypothetical protein